MIEILFAAVRVLPLAQTVVGPKARRPMSPQPLGGGPEDTKWSGAVNGLKPGEAQMNDKGKIKQAADSMRASLADMVEAMKKYSFAQAKFDDLTAIQDQFEGQYYDDGEDWILEEKHTADRVVVRHGRNGA
jgi:hypothetical protein